MAEKNIGNILVTGESTSCRSAVIKYLAGNLSRIGVSSFVTDCGGGLSSLAAEAPEGDKANYPCSFWDLDAKEGLPLRTTVSELGSTLLSKMLGLTDVQEDLMQIYFKIADENDLLLIDTKDLRALINHVSENSADFESTYGKINAQSSSAILRAIAALEAKGGADFLFEPAIDVRDFINTDAAGLGHINILEAAERIEDEEIYSSFLLYILSELAENMPESGSAALAVIIDEAQLLFKDSSRSFINKTVKLLAKLQAKGINAVLACAKESDITEEVRSCFETRIAVKDDAAQITGNGAEDIISASHGIAAAAGDTSAAAVEEQGSGEESTAVAQAGTDGTVVDLSKIKKSLKPLEEDKKAALIEADALSEKYKIPFDRDSAYEFLIRRGLQEESSSEGISSDNAAASEEAANAKSSENAQADASASAEDKSSKVNTEDLAKRAKSSAKSLGNTVAGTVGRQVGKTIGSNFGSFGETLGANIGASLGRGIMNTFFSGD